METLRLSCDILGCHLEFGSNVIDGVGGFLKSLGAAKVLIVTDAGLMGTGIPERISKLLSAGGLASAIFADVAENPTDDNAWEGLRAFTSARCDTLIGLGGGSPIDLAKVIRLLTSHEGPLRLYYGAEGANRITNPMPKLVGIPTTSGTGTEASRGAIITDSKRNMKQSVRSGMPTLSIVDPVLTETLPPLLTAATGMDAMSHCIEAILSTKCHPFAEALGFHGIALATDSIVPAFKNGRDLRARATMALASTLGALAFQKGLGVNHSLAHQLSTDFGVQHGMANAILLPHTMRFNQPKAEDKLTRIAAVMGEAKPSGTAAIERIADLLRQLELPTRLSQVGVTKEGIPQMARKALEDWCHQTNPRTCSETDMAELYTGAL